MLVLAFKVHHSLPPAPEAAWFSQDALRQIWRFAGGLTTITLLVLLLTQVDKVLLSGLLPLQEFGYYTLAGVVAGTLYMIVGPISTVAYPRMTELVAREDGVGLVRTYHEFSQLLSVVVIPVALVLSFFANHVLLLWTHDETVTNAVAPLVSLLVIGTLLNSLMNIPYQLQLTHGWTQLSIVLNTIAVLVLVPAIWLGVTYYGVIAAPIIWIILNAGHVIIGLPVMYKRLLPAEKWRWYREDVLWPGLSALFAVGLVSILAPEASLDTPGLSAVSIAVALTLALALAAMAASRVRKQLAALISRAGIRSWKELRNG